MQLDGDALLVTKERETSMTIELTVAELADVTELDLGASPWRRVEQHRVDT